MKNKFSMAMTLAMIVAMLVTSLAFAGTSSAAQSATPTIASDLDDYAPGDTVNLFGTGWQPDESVHIFVNDDVGSTWSRNVDVIAAGDGTISDSFQLPSWIVATYRVTATGAISGTAVTTFTDAPKVGSVSVGAQSSNPVNQGNSASFIVTVNRGSGSGSPGAFTANLSISGLPAGSSASFSPNSVSFTPSENSKTSTLTIATSCSTPTGSQPFTVKAIRSDNSIDNASGVGNLSVSAGVCDSTPPNTTITANPANPTNSTSATFSFTGTDNVTPAGSLTFECSLDGGSFAACTSSKTYTGLLNGSHTFEVRAKDAANNVDPTPASFAWLVDTVAPTVTVTPDRAPDHNGWYNAAVTFDTNGTDANGIASCTPGQTHSGPDGTGLTVSGSCTDNAGNTASGTSAAFKYDATAPTGITGAPNRVPDSGTWYNHAVGVVFSGSDATSGIASCATINYSGPDGAGVTVNGSCTDNAGNSANGLSSAFDYDGSAPTGVALSVTSGTAGANGWYTSNVTVSTTGTDDVSGVTCTADQFQTSETTGATFNGSCTNGAGLTTNAAPLTVKLDKTGPSASLAVTAGTAGANGWYTSNVTVSTSGSDSISSPVTCTVDQDQTTETPGSGFNGSCTNDAGLSTNAAPLTVKLDKTGPSASLDVTAGTLGANGWYTSDVIVSASGSDNISSPVTCTADQFQTSETAGQIFNGSCMNDAGLTTNTNSLTVKLDKTGPSASLSAVGTLGSNGWYVSNVTIETSGADTISDPTVCTTDQSQMTDTMGTTFNGSCTNDAGLSTDAAPLTIKRDATKPTLVPSISPNPVVLGGSATASPNASDATSGVASSSCDTVDTSSIGAHSVTCYATDNAGNTNSVSANYGVIYNWNGFFQPIDNLPVLNKAKAGSAIPVKFSLSGNQGLNIFMAGYPVSTVTACGTTTTDMIETTVTAGSSSLSYDALADQYIYVWKTDKTWTGCRTLTVKLADGTVHQANFNFVK